MPRYSADDKRRAVDLYKAGAGGEEVAAILGCSPASVTTWANEAGVIRPKGETRRLRAARDRVARSEEEAAFTGRWVVRRGIKVAAP